MRFALPLAVAVVLVACSHSTIPKRSRAPASQGSGEAAQPLPVSPAATPEVAPAAPAPRRFAELRGGWLTTNGVVLVDKARLVRFDAAHHIVAQSECSASVRRTSGGDVQCVGERDIRVLDAALAEKSRCALPSDATWIESSVSDGADSPMPPVALAAQGDEYLLVNIRSCTTRKLPGFSAALGANARSEEVLVSPSGTRIGVPRGDCRSAVDIYDAGTMRRIAFAPPQPWHMASMGCFATQISDRGGVTFKPWSRDWALGMPVFWVGPKTAVIQEYNDPPGGFFVKSGLKHHPTRANFGIDDQSDESPTPALATIPASRIPFAEEGERFTGSVTDARGGRVLFVATTRAGLVVFPSKAAAIDFAATPTMTELLPP